MKQFVHFLFLDRLRLDISICFWQLPSAALNGLLISLIWFINLYCQFLLNGWAAVKVYRNCLAHYLEFISNITELCSVDFSFNGLETVNLTRQLDAIVQDLLQILFTQEQYHWCFLKVKHFFHVNWRRF